MHSEFLYIIDIPEHNIPEPYTYIKKRDFITVIFLTYKEKDTVTI